MLRISSNKSRAIEALRHSIFPLIAIFLALFISLLIIAAMGFDALYALECLLVGALGNLNAVGETMVRAIPLVFMSLSFVFAMRSGMFNLGSMGQFYIGALAGGYIGYSISNLSPLLHIPLMLVCGFVGGSLFSLIPAILKIKFHANELITTIMLNSVAAQILNMLVSGPMRDPTSMDSASNSPLMRASVKLPIILPGTRLHAGLVLAAIAVIFYWFYYTKTTRGYEMRVAGLNSEAARYAGIPAVGNQLIAMAIGGGLAGIGGCVELMSVQSRITLGFSSNLGFEGIAVALLGDSSPIGIPLSAILYGMLNSGVNRMQMLAKVPDAMLEITQAMIILFLAGRAYFVVSSSKGRKKGIPGLSRLMDKRGKEVTADGLGE